MFQKLQCLQPEWVNRKDPILLHNNVRPHVPQPRLQKLNELGYEVLPHLPYSPDLLPTDYHFLQASQQLFAEKMLSQPAGGKKTPAFLEFVESWSMNFYATKINLLLIGKNVLTIMVPILTNKDMFEPSNNDLKFTVRNLKYFCTNLTVIHVSRQLEIFVWYVNPKFTFLV